MKAKKPRRGRRPIHEKYQCVIDRALAYHDDKSNPAARRLQALLLATALLSGKLELINQKIGPTPKEEPRKDGGHEPTDGPESAPGGIFSAVIEEE